MMISVKAFSPTQPPTEADQNSRITHVVAGEVTTLEHELGDDTVEGRALVTLTLGLGAELTEVAGGLGDVLLEEVEDDTARLG